MLLVGSLALSGVLRDSETSVVFGIHPLDVAPMGLLSEIPLALVKDKFHAQKEQRKLKRLQYGYKKQCGRVATKPGNLVRYQLNRTWVMLAASKTPTQKTSWPELLGKHVMSEESNVRKGQAQSA